MRLLLFLCSGHSSILRCSLGRSGPAPATLTIPHRTRVGAVFTSRAPSPTHPRSVLWWIFHLPLRPPFRKVGRSYRRRCCPTATAGMASFRPDSSVTWSKGNDENAEIVGREVLMSHERGDCV